MSEQMIKYTYLVKEKMFSINILNALNLYILVLTGIKEGMLVQSKRTFIYAAIAGCIIYIPLSQRRAARLSFVIQTRYLQFPVNMGQWIYG